MVQRNTTIRDKHRAQIARDKPCCWLCGEPIDYSLATRNPDGTLNPDAYTVDHVIPLNRGGTDTLDNKRAAHRRCNRGKSDRLDGGPILRRSGALNLPG